MIASTWLRRRMQRSMMIAMLLLGLCSAGFGEVILDTGPVSGGFGKVLDDSGWLARQFTLTEATVITSLEGYMYGTQDNLENPPPAEVIATIFSHGQDGFPDLRLYERTFFVPNKPPANVDWHGVTDVRWELDSGTYWAGFVVENEASALVGE